MTVAIQVEAQTAAILEAQARASGLSVEEFLRRLTEGMAMPNSAGGRSTAEAIRDFDAALDELFAGDSRRLPSVPLTYGREDIYFEHD